MKPIASRILVTLVFLVTASVAGAAEYSDLYIIPAAAHAHGAFGTEWRSDVVLHNIQAIPITVEFALVESGRGPAVEPIVVSAGAETTAVRGHEPHVGRASRTTAHSDKASSRWRSRAPRMPSTTSPSCRH
jgi:hypothetical protein